MRLKVFICFLWISLFISSAGFTGSLLSNEENMHFESLNKEDGLIDLSVSSIIQDQDGYIWLGTQGGLLQFSGERSVSYRNDPFKENSLPNNLVQTSYYDKEENTLWLGTYYGVSKFDIETQTFTNYSSDDSNLSNNVIIAIEKDKYGDLWFGTMNGLNRLSIETNIIESFEIDGNVVRSLLLDSKDRLLIGTLEGIYTFDDSINELSKIEIEYPSKYIMTIKEFDEGFLTLGMWGGGVMELDLEFNILKEQTFTDNRVYTILKTSDDTLWVGTWGGGLFASNGDTAMHFPGEGKTGDIVHSVVYSLMEDNKGVLWIGTNGGGLQRLNKNRNEFLIFKNSIDDEDSLDMGKINTIFEDSKNRLWIAVYNKGLNRYSSDLGKMIKYSSDNQKMHNDQIMDMIEYNNMLLAASGDGISKYDEVTDSFVKLGILPKDTIVYALSSDDKNNLWVGTYYNGLYQFDENFELVKAINSSSSDIKVEDNLVYDLVADDLGRIWIVTNSGLYRYDKEVDQLKEFIKESDSHEGLASNNTRSLLLDSKNRIWIGTTGGGLSLYDETSETFTTFTENEGLLDNTIIGIAESDDGAIWVVTRNGISIIDGTTFNVVNLTENEGLGGTDFTSRVFKDVQGGLYFGGSHGVDYISKMGVEANQTFAPLFITNVSVYHESVDENSRIFNGKKYAFDAEQNYLSFEFEAVDYDALSSTNYSYMLRNIDTDWVESGYRNFASYSNIPSGEYEFMVRVKNIQGQYSEPVSVEFSVAIPWYKSKLAYASYILITLSIMYGILKIREGQLLSRRNSELSSLNSRLNDAVKELEAVTIRDPITGGYNRRYFDSVFSDYIHLARRSDEHISLMMMDVDNFKEINDTHGHVVGDHFLRELSQIIEKSLTRSTDFSARFGGDEFAVVLYDTDEAGAKIVADRLVQGVKDIKVDEMLSVRATLSIGVYSAKVDRDLTVKDFVEYADQMLYEAKKSGKNRVEFY